MRPVLLVILFILTSCGLSKQEEIDDAITVAHQLLTSKKCSEAIATLNGVGRQETNADWLRAYASAYACLANWSVVNFFADDLDSISSADQDAILGITAAFDQAVMTSPTDSHYTNLLTAVNTLLYAGGISSPSSASRKTVLTSSEVNNIDVQNLYMILNQIGQYARYYGNTNSAGTKGAGTQSNSCYINYTDANAQAIVAIGGGSCSVFNDGNTDLTGNRERLCQGVVLFNNFLDILASVSLAGSDNAGSLEDLVDEIDDLCAGSALDMGGTCTIKSQSTCVANANANLNIEHLERYFAVVWESMHQ